MKDKCKYCNSDSGYCEYWKDSLDSEWYHDIETGEWDEYDDGFVHQRNYGVRYCEYCGRKLDE